MWSFRRAVYKIGQLIKQAIPCNGVINAGGNAGVYELNLNAGTTIGQMGIKYDAQGIVDRFQIIWDGNIVVDSMYVGDNITNPGNPTGGLIGGNYNLPEFQYDGVGFVATGNNIPVTVVVPGDVANNTTEPTDGSGHITFFKSTAEPTTVTIRVIGNPAQATSWNIKGICPVPLEDLVVGNHMLVYGFYDGIPTKTDVTRSQGIFLGTSPLKFYTNEFGDDDFTMFSPIFNQFQGSQFFHNGTTWWEIDNQGNILSTGSV